jgi:hypothetical protein
MVLRQKGDYTEGCWRSRQLTISFSAVCYSQDQHRFSGIFDMTDQPIVSDSISPQTNLVSGQGFPEVSRIVTAKHTFLQKMNYAPLRDPIQLFEFLQGARVEVNCPGQAVSPPC